MENLQYHLEELKKQLLGLDEQRKFFYAHQCMLELEYNQSNIDVLEYCQRKQYLSSELARIDDDLKSVQSQIDATCHGIEKLRTKKQISSRSQHSSESSSRSKLRRSFVTTISSTKSEAERFRREAGILKKQLDEARKQRNALKCS